VANFSQLVTICTSYGAKYNPSNPALQLPEMSNTQVLAKDCLASLNKAQAAVSNTTAARIGVFKSFKPLVTRISNAAKSSGISKQTKDQVAAIIRKLQGQRATPKLSEEEKQAALAEGKEIVEISSAQTSIDSLLENFDKLIKLLASIPEYAPNEPELTVSSLTALYDDMFAKNQAVINAEQPLNNLRITRNELLYKENTGIVDVATASKIYIKSVFGATSPQYKQVSSLKFTRYKS
jgi:hypothetical protein